MRKKAYIRPEHHVMQLLEKENLDILAYCSDKELEIFLKGEGVKRSKKIYTIKSGYTVRKFLDEFLVVPVEMETEADMKTAILSSGGCFLWNELQKSCTFGDLLLAVTNEFDVTKEEAAKDIEEFLQQLSYHNFLKYASEEENQ